MSVNERMLKDIETTSCLCGGTAKRRPQNITLRWKGKHITIEDVPSYICERNDKHVRLSIQVKRCMRAIMNEAYRNGWSRVMYREVEL